MADKNFKLAGPGRALSENTEIDNSSLQSESPMDLLMRLQRGEELDEEQHKIAERLREAMNKNMARLKPSPEKSSILYTCELFGEDEALPKSEMLNAIGDCLFKKLEDGEADPLYTATSIIHTLNTDDIKIPAMDTIRRYLKHIISHPTQQKFKITYPNKIYQEKVAPCKGAVEFLNATGFRKELSDSEEFLVMDNIAVETIDQALTVLFDGKPIDIKLFRDRKIMRMFEEQENIHYSPRSSDLSNFFGGNQDERISDINYLNNYFHRREHNLTTQIKAEHGTTINIYNNKTVNIYTLKKETSNSFSSSINNFQSTFSTSKIELNKEREARRALDIRNRDLTKQVQELQRKIASLSASTSKNKEDKWYALWVYLWI